MASWRALQNCWIVCSSLAEFCIWLIPGHFGALKKPSVMQPYSTWIPCAQDLNLTSSPRRAATFAERCWSIGSMYNKWVGRGTCVAVHSAGTRTKRCEFGVLMKTLFINHQPSSAKSFLTSTSRQEAWKQPSFQSSSVSIHIAVVMQWKHAASGRIQKVCRVGRFDSSTHGMEP